MKGKKKAYEFEYNGHHYDIQSNSLDFESCPFCQSKHSKKIGECERDDYLTYCFECQKCFEKFYYHESTIDKSVPCKLIAPKRINFR